jgi:hypothetical protein
MPAESTHAADLSNSLASRLWWVAPAVILVLLPLIGMVFGGGPESVARGTSYDASDSGFRGVYLILEELGYPVERSRRPVGGDVRWILFPSKTSAKDAAAINDWIQRGGHALLALENTEFADQIGLAVKILGDSSALNTKDSARFRETTSKKQNDSHKASAPDVNVVYAGQVVVKGPPGGQTWGTIENQPLVTIYQRGRGELWLLNRPDVLTNSNMREGDNAILACRLAEAMLEELPNSRLAFDEYCHGLHDRPNVFELLFRPPVLAATLEVLLFMAFALWHFGARFGSLHRVSTSARRSKEEFLNAMADLLTRKGDRAEAFRTVRNDFLRRLEDELSLAAGTPIEETVREAVRRRGVKSKPLMRLLTASTPPKGAGVEAFLDALHQLEIAANECFQSRSHSRRSL